MALDEMRGNDKAPSMTKVTLHEAKELAMTFA